jgi:DNA-binding response OmpR family regulator
VSTELVAADSQTLVLMLTVTRRQLRRSGRTAEQILSALQDAALTLAPEGHTTVAHSPAAMSVAAEHCEDERESATASQHAGDRAQASGERETVTAAGSPSLEIDRHSRRLWIDGNEVPMTFLEFELLDYFVRNPGRALRREELLSHVWGHTILSAHDRTVDVHVRRLRAKLGHHAPSLITVRRIGYRFDRRRA